VLASAAARASVDCSPAAAPTLGALVEVIRRRRPPDGAWLRAVGFDDALVADRRGPDRQLLDTAGAGSPVVVHHAAGAVAFVNTEALRRLGVDPDADDHSPGVERDATGAATGLVAKRGPVLDRVPPVEATVLAREVGAFAGALVAAGVTSATDATVTNDADALDLLARLCGSAARAPRVAAMVGAAALGDPRTAAALPHHVRTLAVRHAKIVVEGDEPTDVGALVASARRHHLAVALHVTDVDALDRALRALVHGRSQGGPVPDRLEHVSLSLPEQVAAVAATGAAVVTQPAFMSDRRDKYAAQLSEVEWEWLYRVRSLVDAGVTVAASSDAPVVLAPPLRSMAAAMSALNAPERVDAATALAMVTTAAARAGGDEAVLRPGGRGDIVVLGADPLRVPAADVADIPVLATIVGGRVVHAAADVDW